MNAILYFTKSGRATEKALKEIELLKNHTKELVLFRNGTLALSTGEKPEACLGYAGEVPESDDYKSKTIYKIKGGEVVAIEPEGDEAELPLNKIGLPEGSPTTAKGLKEVFTEMELEFHKSAPLNVLVELYKNEVLVLTNE